MENLSKTKQLYIRKFNYPMETINYLCCNDDALTNIKLKKFIGSDWDIKGSGYLWTGQNNLSSVFTIEGLDQNDFNINKYFIVSYLNNVKLKNKIILEFSLFRNTYDNTTIADFRIKYEKDDALEEIGKISPIQKYQKVFEIYCNDLLNIFKETNNKSNIILNHSFTIKTNYVNAFNFTSDLKNTAKILNTDKVWDIQCDKREEGKQIYFDFIITINQNVVIKYKAVKINKIKNKQIEIEYKKSCNSVPAMNEYMKYYVCNISKDLCYFLFQTSLPINISSFIFNTVSNYINYCNKKTKKVIENLANDNNKNK